MRFEKLTNSKIRIIFSSEDMISNNVSVQNFLTDKSISQRILQSILLEAEKEIGFKTDNSKLLVEALSSDGGFIFTITKLSSYDDLSLVNNSIKIFKFENFDNFLDLCTYLQNMNITYSKDFSLILYNNSFYLYIFNSDLSISSSFFNILIEFSDSIKYSAKLDGCLYEYGKIIFNKNAICKGIDITNKKIQ